MHLTRNQILPASPSTAWTMLMDPDTLAKVIPGISSLEKLSENSFKSVLNLKIGPVSGSFTGKLQLEDLIDHAIVHALNIVASHSCTVAKKSTK